MQPQIVFAIGSMLGIGISDFLYKRATLLGAVPATFLLLQAVFFNLSTVTLLLITGRLQAFPLTVMAGGVEASLLYSASTLFLLSLSSSQVSINAPVFRLNFLITSALAILTLGEALTLGKGLATMLAVIAILSFGRVGRSIGQNLRALTKVLLAGLLFGIFGYVYKVAVSFGSDPLSLIAFQGFFFITYATATAAVRGKLRLRRAEKSHAPFCGVIISLSLILLVKSLALGPATISWPISQLSFIITGVLGIMLLNEKLDLPKAIGLASSALAVVAFSGLL